MSEIDWKTELKKIERQFDGLPPVPTAAERRLERDTGRPERTRELDPRAARGVLARFALVLSLSVAILFWPYPARCGAQLLGYFGGVAGIGIGGLWLTYWTWRHRMPKTHALAMLVLLWGLTLAASQVLPRVGYARVGASHPPGWRC